MPLSRRRVLTSSAALCAGLALPRAALAHRQRLSITEVDWNAEAKTLGVTHRFHLHDAEKALVKEGLLDTPDLRAVRAKAKLALYVEDQFGLSSGGESITLSLLGAQIDGHNIFVFQEAVMDAKPSALTVRCEILRDAFPDQRNHVNLRLFAPVQTLTFSGRERIKKAQI